MNTPIKLLATLGAILCGGLIAAAAEDEEAALQVRRLVRRLDAAQLAQRDEAEAKLIELGPDVLELLPQPDDGASAEVTQRIRRIRQTLRRALASSVLEPSRVTLQGDAVPLAEIFSAIESQTGNQIVYQGDRFAGDRPQKIALDETPFWEALDGVLDGASLSIDPYGEPKTLSLRPRSPTQLPLAGRTAYSGPFRLEPVRIDAAGDLRDPANRSLRLTLEVAWEPRLAPISLLLDMADVEAVDERGDPLPVDARRAKLEVPVNPESVAVQLAIPLVLPSRQVMQIAELDGTITAIVPGKTATFRFTDLEQAADVEKRVAGVTVTLRQVRNTDGIWEVHVLVRFDSAGDALASHRGWIFDNEAHLEGPDGQPVAHDGFNTTRQTEDEIGVAYLFVLEGPLTEYAFVYETPALILSAPFDFKIRGVDLP